MLFGKHKKNGPALSIKTIKVIRYAVVDRDDNIMGNRLFHNLVDADKYLDYVRNGPYGKGRTAKQITGNGSMASAALTNPDTLRLPMGMRQLNQGLNERPTPTFTPHEMQGKPEETRTCEKHRVIGCAWCIPGPYEWPKPTLPPAIAQRELQDTRKVPEPIIEWLGRMSKADLTLMLTTDCTEAERAVIMHLLGE